jgi:hypothetical protein
MPNKTIELPHGLLGESMKKNADSISFKVTATCTFCYSDPTPCFPSFLPAGTYTATTPPTTYGPYTPDQTGTVIYNASIPPLPCTTSGTVATPHTITVNP